MKYKIITCRAESSQAIITGAFNDGWQFVSMTAEHVAVSTTDHHNTQYHAEVEKGLIIFILSRNH